MSTPPETGLRTRFERSGETVLEGHVFDPADPDRRFVVELMLDGQAFALSRADVFDPILLESGGDACHGFVFHLDPALVPSLRRAALRLANLGQEIGDVLDLRADGAFGPSLAPGGVVEWRGGLRLSGWVRRGTSPFPPLVEAHADGARIASARANRWRGVAEGGAESPEPGFDLTLPRDFADGRAHRIEVFCEGRPLPGSPVTLIAFADGLRAHLEEIAETGAEDETLRGAFFDAAFPDALPFDAFAAWEKRFPLPPPARMPTGTLAIAVIGEEDAEATLSGPGLDLPAGWIGAALPAGESGRNGFSPADLLRFLREEAADCALVAIVPAGARLRRHALARLGGALEADASAEIAYGDAALRAEDGSLHPLAYPAFDYERALEQGIGAQGFVMRRGAAVAAAKAGASDAYRLFLAPLDAAGPGRAAHLHVPGFGIEFPAAALSAERLAGAVRAHLAARSLPADLTPRPAATLPALHVRREIPSRSVAILLDAGQDETRIGPALEALEPARADRNVQVFVLSPPLGDERAERLRLDGVECIETAPSASTSRRWAQGVEKTRAELVCLLDAALRPLAVDWLAELLSRMAEPDIGAVGPLVLDENEAVLEAGFALRPAGEAAPLFAGTRHGEPGYGDALTVARQAAALGSGCLLTRRADFLALGGFDPLLFPESYGSVDYCLKLQALGRRVVVTPDAAMRRTRPAPRPEASALRREERALRARWGEVMASDPFASPLLDRGRDPYGGLAWPPGDVSPRRPTIRPARFAPPGW